MRLQIKRQLGDAAKLPVECRGSESLSGELCLSGDCMFVGGKVFVGILSYEPPTVDLNLKKFCSENTFLSDRKNISARWKTLPLHDKAL